MIELLVVMAVLAVLAAGGIIAINPGKRIRQANDTRIRNDVGQIATALQAYYTTSQFYPSALADLATSGDLKQVPTPPGGGAYEYSRSGGTVCTTSPYTGCEAALSEPLGDPATTGNVWCWRSATGQASELAPASCTP